jgi:ATP-binding protein involved in chromosome partitioning
VNIPIFIRQIWQKNNYVFSIEWSDGCVQDFRLCDVQRDCPCAHCVDELTGRRLLDSRLISDRVRAVAIRNVGRYALKIQFTSGCSAGIYSFDRLRKMTGEEN